MAISDPGIRFSFDFGDLRRASPTPEPALLPPPLDPLPAGAAATTPAGRPRWLPPLLPVFRTREPLRVSVLGAEAPVWAWRLRSSLAALFASAGGRAGLQVLEWHDGFAIGAPGFDLVPALPHAVVLAAEFDPASVRAASRLLLSLERERCFLVVHGDELGLDRSIGLDAHQVIHVPIRGRAELAELARGVPPGLSDGPFGRACFGLARAIVAGYRQLER
jgi:hypothetical protein